VTRPLTSHQAPAGAEPPQRHPDAPPPGELLPSHYDHCFTCGPAHPTGLHMQVLAGEGVSVRAFFTVTEDHQGAPGLAHGGILTSAVDETFGAIGWLLRVPMVTARLETRFVCPVPVGSVLNVVARCDGMSRRLVYLSAGGVLGDGDIALRSSAVFVQVPLQHFADHGRPEDLDRAAERPEVQRSVAAFEVNP
jgi:acyl-coenzyme A thioesterase PaaI-like protein